MALQQMTASIRHDEGKGASRRLRRAGWVPAVVYGGQQAPVSIQLSQEKVWLAQEHEEFYSSILDLVVDNQTEKVLLRDLQRHPYKRVILHLDFQRVSENQMIHVSVPLHFTNEETSPAGKAGGVVVTHELNEVQIACLPKDLPAFIAVDLADLMVGQVIHLSNLQLPQGVELPVLKLGKEHDVAVVIAKHAAEEQFETNDTPPKDSGQSESKS